MRGLVKCFSEAQIYNLCQNLPIDMCVDTLKELQKVDEDGGQTSLCKSLVICKTNLRSQQLDIVKTGNVKATIISLVSR